MMWIVRWFISAVALYIVSKIVPGISLSNFSSALLAVFIIALVNILIKPLLFLLTLPITVLTLGLFAFILNALMLLLAGNIIPGFHVEGFWAAFMGSILLSIVSTILFTLVR